MTPEPPDGPADSIAAEQRLSYKFQRLRERVRAAITSGELSGKLPGERELASRFKVNTKTLSKALTELAADGLLDRHIGRGTFVRGETPREVIRALLIHGDGRAAGLMEHVDPAAVQLTLHADHEEPSPALLSRFDSVVIASDRLSDEVVRDLVVRGKRVVTIGRRAATFATRAILIDEPNAAASLAQRLVRRGHQKLMIVGDDADGEIMAAIHASMHSGDVSTATNSPPLVSTGPLDAVCQSVHGGVSGLIVLPSTNPRHVINHCVDAAVRIPEQVCLLAIGWTNTSPPCSGIFVRAQQTADALVTLLELPPSNRPVTLWLAGEYIDTGTLGACAG